MELEIDEFKTEVFELLDQAEKALLGFDQYPDGHSSQQFYDEVFRAYHNIKGAAGMMDMTNLQHHVHQLESILMQTKESSTIPKKWIGWFLKGNDVARAIMNNEAFDFDYENAEGLAQSAQASPSAVIEQAPVDLPQEFYSEVNESIDRISSSLLKVEGTEVSKDLIDSIYRDIHSVKGAVQLFGLQAAGTLAHAMENSLENVRDSGATSLMDGHVSTLLLCLDLIGQTIQMPDSLEMAREAEFMVTLLKPFAETPVPAGTAVAVTPAAAAPPVKELKIVSPAAPAHSPAAAHPAASENVEKGDTTIRVQVSLLDRLMTLMGEMVLVRNQVLQYSNKCEDLEFLNLSQKLDVVTSELQEETMKTRMQPIGNILSKFQRVVRDLSGSLNKKINLNLIGVETELDKSLIEAVKDPLTHIVRNACDHGIETPEDRLSHGKSEQGTITIKAYHEGGQVIVDITDDGKGLSREKLLKKAIEKGILTAEKAAEMKDRDVHALIFAPGFSTAEKVTNVSGRGVGMDVVKSNIEKIGGLVEISSQEGDGTRITLKIPLTLAIVPAMIIRSNEDRYAIPQVKLVELVRVDKKSIEVLQGKAVYRLRGNILPLLNLKDILAVSNPEDQEEESFNIVVLNSENHLFGMIVDEILDTADIVVKPLARFLKPIAIYSGATVLGDGRVAFILDILGIAQKHLGTRGQSAETSHSDKYNNNGNELELREFVLVGLSSTSKHAIPLSAVNRMEEFKTSSIEFSGIQRVVRYRGSILKIINLNEVLGYPQTWSQNELTQIIVVKVDDQTFGIEVDQIIDVLSTRDYFDESVSTHDAISGNLVTQNEIIVVVDVEKIFDLTQSKKKDVLVSVGGHSGKRILLVEDTDSIRNKVCQDLEEQGFDVTTAFDGMDGLKKLAEHKCNFDLVISDIEMPRMNGFEFATKLRTIDRMKDVPVIAFTTKNSAADLDKAKKAGFTSFLEKAKVKVLPLLISECLKGKRKVA
jgi:two-component system, chemotaxis family, sensor kinase CheA